MAEVLATKSDTEREDEEAERLVRPSPKVKPPRDDRKREQTNPNRDPDTSTSDPDLSLNHKGPTAASVISRWLLANENERVTVRNKETGETTQVKPDTLTEQPDKYEEVKPEEGSGPDSDLVQALRERIKEDPGFAAQAKALTDPAKLGKIDDSFPLSNIKALQAAFPGLKTVGEARKAVGEATKAPPQAKNPPKQKLLNPPRPHEIHPPRPPKPQKPAKPGQPDVPGKERKDPDAPRDEYDGKPKEKTPAPSKRWVNYNEDLKPEDAPTPGPKPEPGSKDTPKKEDPEGSPDTREYIPLKKVRDLERDPEFQDFVKRYYKGAPSEDGSISLTTERDGGATGTLESLSYDQQTEILQGFYRWSQAQHKIREKYKDQDPDQATPDSGEDELKKLKEKYQPSDQKKPSEPEPQRAPPAEEEQAPSDEEDTPAPGGATPEALAKDEAFLAYALESLGAKAGSKGTPFFPTKKDGKTRYVQFGSLPPKDQQKLADKYTKDRDSKAQAKEKADKDEAENKAIEERKASVFEAASKKPEVKKALASLLKEGSAAKGTLAEAFPDTKFPKAIQGLTVEEARSVAQDLFKTPPPVKWSDLGEATYREISDSYSLIDRTFPKAMRKSLYSLHPKQVAVLAQAYKDMEKAGPDLASSFLDNGDYTLDPSKVLPPLEVPGPEGKKVSFQSLDPKAQQEAMESHRLHVVAASLRAQQSVAEDYTKDGFPGSVARALASFQLKPHKSEEDREVLSKKMARKVFSHALSTPAPSVSVDRKKALKSAADPDSQRIALEWLKGSDLRRLQEKYMGPKAESPFSEHDSPAGFLRRLRSVAEDIDALAKEYPSDYAPEVQDLKPVFRAYLLDKLGRLNPSFRNRIEKLADDAPERSWLRKMFPKPKTQGSTKEWLRSFQASFYPPTLPAIAMKTALYHGIEPYSGKNAPQAYPGWQPLHARDWSPSDEDLILKEARKVLNLGVPGRVPDAAYREALDLALRTTGDGKYSVGLHPALYNELLAKLEGVSPKETLLTLRKAGTMSQASVEIRRIASSLIKACPEAAFDLTVLADKLAQDEGKPWEKDQGQQDQGQKQAQQDQAQQSQDQGQKQAQQDQGGKPWEKKDEGQAKEAAAFRSLKSLVLKTAHGASDRTPYLPIVKAIKDLGVLFTFSLIPLERL